MRKICYLLLVCFLVGVTRTMAQDSTANESGTKEKKVFDKSRLFFGGNFGLAFGNRTTLVNISPQVGYRFNDYLAAGMGVNGQYSRFKYDFSRQTLGIAGMNVFGRFYPLRQGFLQLQPEFNYIWGKYEDLTSDAEYSLNGKVRPSLLAGAGVVLGGMVIMAQYDLLYKASTPESPGTPYGNKVFLSIGYYFGNR